MSQSNNGQSVNLSSELMDRVRKLKRDDQTFAEVVEQVVSLGCYQLEYRRENGEVRKAKQKIMREVYKKAQADPELAIKLGLGTRVAL
jgi:hypothetical protein